MEDLPAQPRCPSCKTVLVDVHGGYRCGGCQVTYLPQHVS